MQLARVIGDVVATRKDPGFDSTKLLLLQPIGADGKDAGRPLVAVDSVGAGVGETCSSFAARKPASRFIPPRCPPTPASSASSITGRSRRTQMILARVVGQVVSTQKRPQFEGAKLLLVQPETPQGEARGVDAARHRLGRRRRGRAGHRRARGARRRRGARQETGSRRRRNCWYRRSIGVCGVNPQITLMTQSQERERRRDPRVDSGRDREALGRGVACGSVASRIATRAVPSRHPAAPSAGDALSFGRYPLPRAEDDSHVH